MARKQLKDSAGVNFYPYSDLESVIDNNGNTLSALLSDRLKYVLLSQAEYDSLATKDSGTLYLIGGVKYSVSLELTGSAHVPTVTINNVVYQQTDFPIEVNSGESLTIVCGGSMNSITITMGGSTVATGISGDTLTIPDVNNNVVIAAHSSAPE